MLHPLKTNINNSFHALMFVIVHMSQRICCSQKKSFKNFLDGDLNSFRLITNLGNITKMYVLHRNLGFTRLTEEEFDPVFVDTISL